jgi:hypothetical protein
VAAARRFPANAAARGRPSATGAAALSFFANAEGPLPESNPQAGVFAFQRSVLRFWQPPQVAQHDSGVSQEDESADGASKGDHHGLSSRLQLSIMVAQPS